MPSAPNNYIVGHRDCLRSWPDRSVGLARESPFTWVGVLTSSRSSFPQPLRSQASTVGRANRGGDLLSPGGSQYNGLLGPGSSATTGRAGLRMKKSAPDMKRNMADRESFNSGNGMLAPGAGLVSRKSNSNLREGYSATMGRRPQAGGIGGAAGLQVRAYSAGVFFGLSTHAHPS